MWPLFILTIENDDDRDFIAELYRQYYPIMKKKAYEITGDYNIVDDLIDDAFVKLIDKISILRNMECCKRASYIVHTIRNISINYCIRCSGMEAKEFLGMSDDLMGSIPEDKPTVEKIFAKEDCKELLAAIQELKERDRDLLYYKYNLELSDKKIAETMDIPANNIREYLVRARRRVLNILGGKGL